MSGTSAYPWLERLRQYTAMWDEERGGWAVWDILEDRWTNGAVFSTIYAAEAMAAVLDSQAVAEDTMAVVQRVGLGLPDTWA